MKTVALRAASIFCGAMLTLALLEMYFFRPQGGSIFTIHSGNAQLMLDE